MNIGLAILLFIIGLVLIIFGGNYMVINATRISVITGIPQALIGATIVSLATTLPELNVVVFSALDGIGGMAIGNSVGSIIFNLSFIMGIVFLFTKNILTIKSLGSNFYIMQVAIIIVFIFSIFDVMNKWAGMILLSIFLMFFITSIIEAKKNDLEVCEVKIRNIKKVKNIGLFWAIILFCISSFFVSMGAKFLVNSGENIAKFFNISEHIIGVTIIAIGTSLPEVVTAISSIKQNSSEIAIGNTIGANILSSTLLLGISAILEPNKLVMHQNIVFVALPLIILSSLIILIPILFKKHWFKIQGIMLLSIFVFYYLTVII